MCTPWHRAREENMDNYANQAYYFYINYLKNKTLMWEKCDCNIQSQNKTERVECITLELWKTLDKIRNGDKNIYASQGKKDGMDNGHHTVPAGPGWAKPLLSYLLAIQQGCFWKGRIVCIFFRKPTQTFQSSVI